MKRQTGGGYERKYASHQMAIGGRSYLIFTRRVTGKWSGHGRREDRSKIPTQNVQTVKKEGLDHEMKGNAETSPRDWGVRG